MEAVQNFFQLSKMLKEVNCTIIALVPKSKNNTSCGDFRPICCNIIYKCISKIVANRMKGMLPKFINQAQVAFMEGRKIGNNILFSQELLHHYNRGSDKVRRYAIKVDLLKAYDSVRWNFILKTLKTPKFSIALNGELTRIFGGTMGLRKGDPIFPYLFVIAMEILSRLMFRVVAKEDFK
ncbi:uncharacterized protein LOC116129328 [Pistacia vera]|uniref:uncharacterized protein LOC116129328 n=1 Tax=Pistacia vera TaxID=55513 RepID=UPI001262B397|nr:uncharacterized protein LOC116129328 [Pistacia vera]